MPSPTSSLATLRPDLGSMLEFDLAADRNGFVCDRVAPVIPVARQAGVFGKIPIEQLLETRTTSRAPGSNYARGNWKFDDDSYACQEHGAEEPVDDREASMYAEYFDAETISAMRARDAVLRNREIRVAALVQDATTFAAQITIAGVEWDTAATAVPITNVETAVRAFWARTGVWPNAILMNRHVFRNLRVCDSIIAKVHSTGAGSSVLPENITEQHIAQAFDLQYVIVAGAAKNSANKGQSVSIATVWDDEYAAILRIPETNDVREPASFRTFHWAGDGSSIDGTVESYREESIRGNVIRVRQDVHEKLMYTEMVQLISNVTT